MAESVAAVRPDYDVANYDESRVAPFSLEDPLVFADGRRVLTGEDWGRRRREILGIFAREMYGAEPPPPETVLLERFDEKEDALAGFAVRSQYRMRFRKDGSGPCVHWLLLRPRFAKGPVPVVVFLNYRGNHELVPDPGIPVMDGWVRKGRLTDGHRATEATRGIMADPDRDSVLPIGMIIARGFAVLSACYAEVSPDPDPDEPEERFSQAAFPYTGVFGLWGSRDETRPDNPTSLGAWAWTLSRAVDLAERIPALDARRVVATGCSRLGKAALLAAARDERIAVCVPNQCGGGGVTLAKRDFGENIATETRMFTHWYCKAYRKYERNPARLLSFDQHLLVAAIAPRPLLVQGFDSPWFDPLGEFLACRAASPAWEFLGRPGLPRVDFPDDFETSAIGECLGYCRRSQKHGISAWDWTMLLDFSARHLLE